MQLERALADLSEIHAQVLRSEVYRGFRARTCLTTAGVGLVAATSAALRPLPTHESFAAYWCAVALLAAAVGLCDVLMELFAGRETGGRTRAAAFQLLPALALGATLPWVLLRAGGDAPTLLPGLWCALFGLGLLATRPFLPRTTGYVAVAYAAVGIVLAATARSGVPSPWAVALPFVFGQIAMAFVLRRGEARLGAA